ncbi:hypothetical protein RJ55_03878 [Drechmeria coniospora]|nr:hypothetical protein RJ55_03878 [Drechmeria coniospora]
MSPHSEVVFRDGDATVDATNGTSSSTVSPANLSAPSTLANGHDGHNGLHNDGQNGQQNGQQNGLHNGLHNGLQNGLQDGQHPSTTPGSQYLRPAAPGSEYDLVCVGFGPASLAIAIAMHDALAAGKKLHPDGSMPKVLFVEKQAQFGWHAGMLLPGSKMQISFIKDLATLRDPRSEFTFLNYLHRQHRLVDFTNLGTFLPARVEYEDYLRWCSSHFDKLVQFGQEVVSVTPDAELEALNAVRTFTVKSVDVSSGKPHEYRARNVLVATGGQPSLPKNFPLRNARVIHSSQYAHRIRQILPEASNPYRIAVVGAGQSAAEIFNNLQWMYPNSKTYLVMRPEFLRPSDDSPFVNSVFNPEYIDNLFPRSAKSRSNLLTEARATNYGVVRLELIEAMYELMYEQKRALGPDETKWPHRIMGGRQITSIESMAGPDEAMELTLRHVQDAGDADGFVDVAGEETLGVDLVIAATGYQRDGHVEMLRGTWDMLPKSKGHGLEFGKGISGWNVETEQGERKMAVGRDYKVKFSPGTVADRSGIWLQGCCEGTHGLSDTLLSVLATRSGEIVESMFYRAGTGTVKQQT